MLTDKTFRLRIALYTFTFFIAWGAYRITGDTDYLKLFWIGAIGFVNVEVMYYLSNQPSTSPLINRLYGKCYVACEHPICKKITLFRGTGYFLTTDPTDERKLKTCILSLWGVLHFILFAIIGYFVPNKLPLILLISVVYEGAEYLVANCHDLLDVVLNVSGYLVGS